MTDKIPSLSDLRREIDGIDDAIHDLIMRRAQIAERVRAAKGEEGGSDVFLRPGREAAVLHRLVDRHGGPFPKRTLVRLWREIFAAIVSMQGKFSLAVWVPEIGEGYQELARDQYGSHTPATLHQSLGQVTQEVLEGRATVGVLPLPTAEDALAWWPQLMSDMAGTPRVVSRLPVAGSRSGKEALSIARMDPESSGGKDRALLALESGANLSRAGSLDALRDSGFDPVGVMDVRSQGPDVRLTLVEVKGFVPPNDTRLASLGHGGHGPINRAVVVGCYAQPFSSESMDGGPVGS
ncbi:MAG: chorismate mutase [Rhodospirillum sp.]|nr:chorismate mutase [Rhodospirillum sp.]MCF8491873.1 chorismate mutase [Rhodospirillum sp.]MCF8502507.1 chorismate mutase [Rhodospirillum sp.]